MPTTVSVVNPEPALEADPATPQRRCDVLRWMAHPRIVGEAFKVALVVGTVLNFINHGAQLWALRPANLWQVALNFVVPYCVSSYSAARNEAQNSRRK